MQAGATAGPRGAWRHSPLPPARRTCILRTPSRYGEAKTTPRPPFPADPSSAESAPLSAGPEVPVSPRRWPAPLAVCSGQPRSEGRGRPLWTAPLPGAAATGPLRPWDSPTHLANTTALGVEPEQLPGSGEQLPAPCSTLGGLVLSGMGQGRGA